MASDALETYPYTSSKIKIAIEHLGIYFLTDAFQHRSWLTGNLTSFLIETPYELLGRCVKHMPNEGLLRFYIVGNLEWIFVTSPQALREMLASKVYAFEKPELLRCRLQNAVGDGLILAEGEEHKVIITYRE